MEIAPSYKLLTLLHTLHTLLTQVRSKGLQSPFSANIHFLSPKCRGWGVGSTLTVSLTVKSPFFDDFPFFCVCWGFLIGSKLEENQQLQNSKTLAPLCLFTMSSMRWEGTSQKWAISKIKMHSNPADSKPRSVKSKVEGVANFFEKLKMHWNNLVRRVFANLRQMC